MIWLGLVLALAFSARLRTSVLRGVLVIGLLYIALKHQRYHALVGLVSPFVLAVPIAEGLRRHAREGYGHVEGTARLDQLFQWLARPARARSIAVMVVIAGSLAAMARDIMPSGPPPAITPSNALAAFQATGVRGRVLNSYAFGGYLIFRGVPVFVDGRSDMFGDEFLSEAGRAFALSSPHALVRLMAKYQIGWTMLAPQAAVVELLDHLPEWQRIYTDSIAVVHVRREPLK